MKGNTETLNYVGIHVQNFLIAAHYNGATLAVSVGNDECGIIRSVWTLILVGLNFHALWIFTFFVIYFRRLTL